MADSGGQISGVPDQVLDASIPVKKRRNKPADRIKSRLSKSSKLRAGTPEPEQRTFTDDSEKDISDGEYLPKSGLPEADGEGLGRHNSGIRRMINRGKHDTARSRSLERPTAKETESEDDFEVIRRMHKNKELEEERKEAEKLIQDTKPKVEELREFVPKEMPPLIVAPKDLKKRRRHKSLPLQESQSEEEKPKTPLVKARERVVRRKPSTSEEEDLSSSRRGSAHSKAEDDGSELRVRKIGAKRIIKTIRRERDTSESEGVGEDEKPEDDRTVDDKIIEEKEESKSVEKKPWFFTRWFSKSKEINSELEDKNKNKEEGKAEIKEKEEQKIEKKEKEDVIEKKERESIMKEKQLDDKREKEESSKEKVKRRWLIAEIFYEWRDHVNEHKVYYHKFMRLKNRCATDLLILLLFCGFGGLVFRFTEGAFESFYKCGVKRVKRDFIDTLWKYSQYMLEEDWKSQARRKLMEFEDQLHSAHEAGMTTYSGQKSWSFLNAVVYCLTVVTTIGYGHISPSTTTGRAITIIYAIFGIPMFLILLADFGKLFTRGIKFLWAFVRRLYYTGSCRRVRKTAPVQEMMKGVQIMYDFAKARRQTMTGYPGQQQEHQNHLRPPDPNMQGIPETPGTPNWSAFEIDDEFNLPISVAISILLIYIFLGATLYWMWEDWSFFESFYFVFISMSTIGFGDFVPQHPMYMMLSIVYLMFGLALTSMCINVVQEKLSDTFRQASAKLGTTIGLTVVEDPAICPPDAIIMEENNQQMS